MMGARHLDDLVRPAQSFAVVKRALHEKTMAEVTHLAYALGRVASLAFQGWADAAADEPEEGAAHGRGAALALRPGAELGVASETASETK
jgi:hypothetical protein